MTQLKKEDVHFKNAPHPGKGSFFYSFPSPLGFDENKLVRCAINNIPHIYLTFCSYQSVADFALEIESQIKASWNR